MSLWREQELTRQFSRIAEQPRRGADDRSYRKQAVSSGLTELLQYGHNTPAPACACSSAWIAKNGCEDTGAAYRGDRQTAAPHPGKRNPASRTRRAAVESRPRVDDYIRMRARKEQSDKTPPINVYLYVIHNNHVAPGLDGWELGWLGPRPSPAERR